MAAIKKKFALYYYEVSDGEDTLQFSPTHYVDITETEPAKRAACYAHASQTPDRYYALQDQVAAFRGVEGGYKRAEAFVLQLQSPAILCRCSGGRKKKCDKLKGRGEWMSMDLSTAHAPIGQFLEQPEDREEWQKFRLSDEQIAWFNEQGYLAGVQVLNDRQIDSLCSELAGLMKKSHPANYLFHEYHSNESKDPNAVLFHALGAWRTGPAFHDVLWSPAFLVPASQLLGGPVRFWHDQLFCKPAHHGGVVAWHQDYSYWTRTEPMSHLTCWIALDDSDRDNGCLYYVPGSHRWKLLPVTGLTGNMDEIMTVLTPEQKQAFLPVPIELKR